MFCVLFFQILVISYISITIVTMLQSVTFDNSMLKMTIPLDLVAKYQTVSIVDR